MIGLAVNHGERGGEYDDEYILVRGSDAHADIPPEFWDHLQIVTGRNFAHRADFFSCSC